MFAQLCLCVCVVYFSLKTHVNTNFVVIYFFTNLHSCGEQMAAKNAQLLDSRHFSKPPQVDGSSESDQFDFRYFDLEFVSK